VCIPHWRVPASAAEILFDQGLGDVFDNRVAGNVVDPAVIGRRLLTGSAAVRDARAAGKLAVVGARYDLDTAAVTLVH
jgi:carbonic anhydrase